jgi:hypothetical protein
MTSAEPAAKAANVILLLGQLFKVAEKNLPSLVMGAFGWASMSSAKRLGGLSFFALVWLHGQVCVRQALDAELEYVAAFCAAAVLVSQQQSHWGWRRGAAPSFFKRARISGGILYGLERSQDGACDNLARLLYILGNTRSK